ncbi:Retrovirus-related Pol polyprotein from transposon TNT 1-94 [Linum perenne]
MVGESSSSHGEGLYTRGRQKEKSSSHGSRGQSSSNYKGRSKSRPKSKSCRYCKRDGHDISECHRLQYKERRDQGKSEDGGKASVVANDSSDGEMLVVFAGCTRTDDEWILDSACTFHMCPNMDWFSSYESIDAGGTVLMGDNSSCKVAGIRSVQIKMFDGAVRTLTDVRHIPDLKRNLISLSTLDSKGYK